MLLPLAGVVDVHDAVDWVVADGHAEAGQALVNRNPGSWVEEWQPFGVSTLGGKNLNRFAGYNRSQKRKTRFIVLSLVLSSVQCSIDTLSKPIISVNTLVLIY